MSVWSGTCHCGLVRFSIDADIDHARSCDCSICRRRGALIFRVEEAAFTLHSSWDELAQYRFHTRTATDYFCKTCGVLPFRRPRTAPHLWAVNLRCIDALDLETVRIELVEGSRLP